MSIAADFSALLARIGGHPVLGKVPASTPEGVRIWAVGDIHGRADLLRAMRQAIVEREAEEPASSGAEPPVLVFLGDYIDRGPDSRGVIQALLALREEEPSFSLRFIRGNHEQMAHHFLDDPRCGLAWAAMGGTATLKSYGVEPPMLESSPSAWAATAERFRLALPAEHLAFLLELEPCITFGDYFFAHAGVDPRRALAKQRSNDLMWVRERFLNHTGALEMVVVHGHTPTPEPVLDGRRIGIDTGAYASGVLTAIRLSGLRRQILQVRTHGALANQTEVIWRDAPQA